jgi:hypothetical protein
MYVTSIFKMKDLCEVDIIISIKVKKHNIDCVPNQSYYIENMLDKFKHLNIKKAYLTLV